MAPGHDAAAVAGTDPARDREQAGGLPARIVAKMNQLEDPELIEAICEAASAGVPIDLIIRGFCCLRPGVPGRTEGIRVRSIIGRFLEHSRIFHFAAGQEDPVQGEFFIGSADWMFRNLSKRVEVVTPVLDADGESAAVGGAGYLSARPASGVGAERGRNIHAVTSG